MQLENTDKQRDVFLYLLTNNQYMKECVYAWKSERAKSLNTFSPFAGLLRAMLHWRVHIYDGALGVC